MQGIKPRTLTNGELIQQASDQLHEGVLDIAMLAEVLRRLNYYTEGKENQTANFADPRQLELPL
ncbi:MAG: hypothetical protein ACO3S8_07745 [Aquiluna sp.]